MSFPGRILASNNIFKPALHYLSKTDPSSSSSNSNSNNAPSTPPILYATLDDIDNSPPRPRTYNPPTMNTLKPWHSRESSGELDPNGGAIPLINYSRTPSPSPYRTRTRSATQSEDEDEGIPLSLRPLVAEISDTGQDGLGGFGHTGRSWWRSLTKSESLGGFLFGTWAGWQVYVGLLVLWSLGTGFVMVLMMRFILWSEYYQTLVTTYYVSESFQRRVDC
jgi:hypothetical protein